MSSYYFPLSVRYHYYSIVKSLQKKIGKYIYTDNISSSLRLDLYMNSAFTLRHNIIHAQTHTHTQLLNLGISVRLGWRRNKQSAVKYCYGPRPILLLPSSRKICCRSALAGLMLLHATFGGVWTVLTRIARLHVYPLAASVIEPAVGAALVTAFVLFARFLVLFQREIHL